VTRNDVTWPQVTGSDSEVTSFDLKRPGSGGGRPKTGIYCAFDFLQCCTSQAEAVTWHKLTSGDLRWPEVTQKWRDLTGSHMEISVEGRKLEYTLRFTSYKAVACRRQSRHQKARQVNSSDCIWCGSDVIWPESPGSGCRRSKVRFTVRFTSYKAVARRRRQSRDWKWRHVTSWPGVTRKWRYLTGSHLEVAVQGRKLAYTVHLTSFEAVARSRRQSRDRKWRHVTSGDRKGPKNDVMDWSHLELAVEGRKLAYTVV